MIHGLNDSTTLRVLYWLDNKNTTQGINGFAQDSRNPGEPISVESSLGRLDRKQPTDVHNPQDPVNATPVNFSNPTELISVQAYSLHDIPEDNQFTFDSNESTFSRCWIWLITPSQDCWEAVGKTAAWVAIVFIAGIVAFFSIPLAWLLDRGVYACESFSELWNQGTQEAGQA